MMIDMHVVLLVIVSFLDMMIAASRLGIRRAKGWLPAISSISSDHHISKSNYLFYKSDGVPLKFGTPGTFKLGDFSKICTFSTAFSSNTCYK